METARVLLRHGADPNTAFTPEDLPDNPLSCLYAATGLNNNPVLGLALLEAGVNPNDGESLYHSTEHRDLECVKLLLRHGATPAGTNALKHMLDREDLEGTELLVAAGANPNETNGRGETALHWAVSRGRSAAIAGLLLDHGASLAVEAEEYNATPTGWFGHGVHNCHEDGGDYASVARLLIAAGAIVPRVELPTGNPEVDAVFREHGMV